MPLLAAVTGALPVPPTALPDLQALCDPAHPALLLRAAQLGEHFELAPLPAWEAWVAGAGAGFLGQPLRRTVERQPDGTLSVCLRPVLLRVAGGGAVLCPPRAPPSAVLKQVHASQGASAQPLHRLRLWLVDGGGGRALFAGPRPLEEWLGEEEAAARVCARELEVEVRAEDGSWPRGDTTRAVRARALWPPSSSIAPEVTHLVAKDPLRNLVECAVPAYPPPSYKMVLGQRALYEVTSVLTPKVDGKLIRQGCLEDDFPDPTKVFWRKDEWDALEPPLTHTPPFRSRLRVGDPALVRVSAPNAGVKKGELVWTACWVQDLDHGSYPPAVTLAVKGMKKPLVLGLECAAIREALAPDAEFPRPAVLAEPIAAPFADALPSLAAGELPPLAKTACGFPRDEVGSGTLSGALIAAGVEGGDAARAAVLDSFLVELQAGFVDAYKAAWHKAEGGHGMHGLANLGNTCFMNSILQCISAVEPLSRFFLGSTVELQRAINELNEMSYGGRIALAWAAFLRAQRQNRGGEVLVPRVIKDLVSEKAAHFTGFQQHDSEEFARFLLDYLMEDTTRNKAAKKPHVPSVEDEGMTDEARARAEWHAYTTRNGSPVTDLFAGSYVSKVKCLTCGNVSTKCDPFTSLQVPLAPPAGATPSFQFKTVDAKDGWSVLWKVYYEPEKTGPLTVAQLCAWVDAPQQRAAAASAAAAAKRGAKAVGAKAVGAFLSAETAAAAAALVAGTAATSWLPVLVHSPSPFSLANADRFSIHRHLALDDVVTTFPFKEYHPLLLEVPPPPEGGAARPMAGGLPPSNSYAIVSLRCIKAQWEKGLCFPIYWPFAVALPPGATCAQAADAVFARMRRFMSPACADAFTAAEPPYTLLRGAPHPGADDATEYAIVTEGANPAQRTPRTLRFRNGAVQLLHTPEPLGAPCALMVSADLDDKRLKNNQKFDYFPAPVIADYEQHAWDISLEVPCPAPPAKPQSLASCLARNEQGERMEGPNQVYCGRCKEHRDGEKTLRVWRLPPILLIQLKRYSRREGGWGGFYAGSGTVVKNMAKVTFPVLGLDMAPFVCGPDGDELPAVARPPGPWPAHGPAPQPQPAGGKLLYDLFAVSQHSGTMAGGHYTAAAQDFETGRWHDLNDSTEMPLAGGPGALMDSSAYILFYRRRDTEGPAVLAANVAAEALLGGAAGGGGGGGGGGGATAVEESEDTIEEAFV
jgi:ubiquitin C-terminal hydrolase